MRLIGITGYKRAGKDAIAARLVDAHGFRRFAFADPLKEAALALDPFILVRDNERHIWSGPSLHRLSLIVDAIGWEEAKRIGEVRRTLQRFGVGIREIMPRFWVEALAISVGASGAQLVVVPDVRFENEERWIHQQGGTLVRVTRPGTGSDGHISEELTATLLADYEIANDGDLDSLHRAVDLLA